MLLSLLESRFVSPVQAGYWPQHSDATFSLFSFSDVPDSGCILVLWEQIQTT